MILIYTNFNYYIHYDMIADILEWPTLYIDDFLLWLL